jgi:hypothetical protein
MIQVTRLPLPEPEKKEILKWLRDPAAYRFQQYLRSLAAEKSAESLLKANQGDGYQADAKQANDEAQRLIAFSEIMASMLNPEYEFVRIELKPTVPNKIA